MDSVNILIGMITLAYRKSSLIDRSDFVLFEVVTKHTLH